MLNKIFLLTKKPSSKKKLKKRMLSTPNYFFPQKKPKTPSYYQKIYTISTDSLNKSKLENSKSPIIHKKKIISLDNIFKKPKLCQSTFQFRKITNPKLPFSSRKIEPKEVVKNRIKLSKPSTAFHDFTTIQWLRQKFSENIINKSIYSLLPNNGKPVIPEHESEEDKRHRKMIEFLESMKEPLGREKYVNINPKYFFTKTTFENVLKLKKIFLEFDKDGNRRMELDEMLEMFMSNKISANINDLVELFFKGKKFKEKEVMKLYLNFHQFIYFALTKDQDFRQFIRIIKERSEKEKEKKIKEQKKLGITTNNPNEKDYENEKDGYLPMSFNSLLDYFVDKGKERASKEVINKAIEEMNRIINKTKNKFNLNDSVRKRRNDKEKRTEIFKPNNEMKRVKIYSQKNVYSASHSMQKHISHRNIKKIKINKNLEGDEEIERINFELSLDNNDYENQLKNINFNKIIEEFYTLFNIDKNLHHNNNDNKENKIKSPQRKEQEKKEKEKENKTNLKDKDINNKIIKSYSQSILNSFSTRSQDNLINNLKSSTKGDSNTFHKSQKNEISTIKDYKLISGKNKFLNYGSFNKNNSNKYKYINLNNNSRNKNNLIYKNLKNIDSENKSLNSFNKSQIELPQIYEKHLKLKNNSNNMFSFDHNSKIEKHGLFKSNSYFKYPLSKSMKEKRNNEFNNTNKINKYFVNIYGGKINLFKNINESSTKLDYVPMKLLTNLKHKLKNKNI